MDRLEAMSTFVAAIESGSFSAAARKLGTPLPTVSRKVSELEAHLKTRLLTRSSRRLVLTEAGRAYLIVAKGVLEQIAAAERAAAGEYEAPRGELLLTAPIVFGRLHVLPVLLDFLRAYPEIDIRAKFVDRVINLLEERVDLAIRAGDLPDSNLVASRVGAIKRVVCASPSYLAARGTPEKPEDLGQHDCITFESIGQPDVWRFEIGKSVQVVPVRSRLVVNTAEAAVEAACSGLGITRVFSYQVAESERCGKLVRVLGGFEPTPLPIHLVYAESPLLPLKLRAFLDFAVPRLKARLS